jgi:hypothetical protein
LGFNLEGRDAGDRPEVTSGGRFGAGQEQISEKKAAAREKSYSQKARFITFY